MTIQKYDLVSSNTKLNVWSFPFKGPYGSCWLILLIGVNDGDTALNEVLNKQGLNYTPTFA